MNSMDLEIDKCVVSRLWYTTWNILSNEIQSKFNNISRDEIIQLINLIQSNTNSQNYHEDDSWIILKILQLLGANDLAAKPELLEFIAALKFMDNDIPSDVENELLELFNKVCDSKNLESDVERMSVNTVKFLDKSLQDYPAVACSIIKSLLCVWSQFFNESDAELQNIYVKFFQENLGTNNLIKKTLDFDKVKSSSVINSNGTLLSILSKFELTEAENNRLINWLFPALFNNLNHKDVGLAFYARKSNEYYNEWIVFRDANLMRSKTPVSVDNAFGISNAMFTFNDNEVIMNPGELTCRTIKLKRHWLLDILDICYALLSAGYADKVSTILSAKMLDRLWPALYFRILENLLDNSSACFGKDAEVSPNLCKGLRYVLNKCEPVFIARDEEMWKRFKIDAENQLNVVEWVLKNKKINTDKDLTIKKVFSLILNHGVLFTLNSTTDLQQRNYNEIKELLKNYQTSNATFQAYYSMLCALKAILSCDSYSSNSKNVEHLLTEMKNTLTDIFPIDIRIETVENIFSMLFLRHEDFNISDLNSEDSEGETGADECKIEKENYRRIESGFICNEYIIRDLLHYLKNVIAESKDKTSGERNFDNVARAIAEATWRLELLTSSQFVRKVGYANDAKDVYNFSEILLTKKLNASKIMTNESILYQQADSSSSEEYAKSEIDLSSDAGSVENNNSYAGGSRKKSWKKNVNEKTTTILQSNYSFIMNFMLSSKESFIIQCLWKCDFDKAQKVIEIFNMGDSQLDGEVRFSKAIGQFRQRINENIEVSSPVETVNGDTEISTLQNIRQAVKDAIHSSRLTGQLETFLASNKATLRLINPEEVNTNEVLTMAVLDLALTTGKFRSCSLNACEVASRYLKSCKKIERSPYSVYFHKICKLFYESKLDLSLPDILCDARIPLSVQKFNEKLEFWNEVERVIRIFGEARSNRGKIIKDLERQNDIILSQEAALNFIATSSNGEPYLSKIFNHLDILRNIIPGVSDGNFDGTFFAMLEIPVQSYLGYQFFELGVEPKELDVVAKKLGVNLVHSILVSCCPKFTFNHEVDKIKTKNTEENGYVILNDDSTSDVIFNRYDKEKPNECVAEILTQLLKSIGDIYPNKSTLKYTDMKNLWKNEKIRDILITTSCIANIDLCELSAGNETLTFFLNVWNLLFLHALLTIWSKDTPCNRFQHYVSTTKIGYKIGELGFVSLAALRSKLLGNLSWDFEYFKNIEDINEPAWLDLDLEQDPRVIFAMANEFFGTPLVRPYESNNLDEALNKAIRNYIACYNLIDPRIDDREVDLCWLPELVCRYQDFILENASLARQNSAQNFDESFTLRKFLNTNEKNCEFKYFTQVYKYELRFDYSGKGTSTKSFDISRRYSNNVTLNKNINENLLQYFEGNCWLLSYLVQKIHEKSPTDSAKACENAGRCSCLENLLRSRWTELLKNTFGKNQALIGMHENISSRDIWTDFEHLVKKEKWKQCLNVINALPDNLTVKNHQISSLKDKVLSVLLSAQGLDGKDVMIYVRQMKNIHILASAILSNLKRWPIEACKHALTYFINHSEKSQLPTRTQQQINTTLNRVTAFSEMLPHFENDLETMNITWYGIACGTNKTDPFKIVKSLIDANKFELCLEWLKFHSFSTEMQSLVTNDLLIGSLENDSHDFEPATKLLQALPKNRSLKLSYNVLKKLESLPAIKFITNYLLENCKPADAVKYHKISISIEILSLLDCRERTAFIHLLKEPLLMFEQLLMNGKFEILNKILNTISESLPKAGISLDDIDKIVRYYASKSLEFRVALQRDGIESRSGDSVSLNTETEKTEFVMPSTVPTKDEWVPNDKSRVCSCCKSVVFSMFNRRHHCRRCGRVVCAVCSQQRMRVPTYPDSVHVRVCDDCKRQTIYRMQQQHGAPSTPSSETFDYWRLTRDKTHNQTVKDEFSFEHAPSISLCLAILNLHSDDKAYASFLLDRCDEIKQLLCPVGSGRANPEVDQKLLVRMIRSLLLAAKVKYAKLSLNSGLDNCDRLLSHVDLVATLVQSDCSALVPTDNLRITNQTKDDENLFRHTLRRVRDLLTEKEQWILALDVSTKSGLDRQGVWAAWGKAFLKVGCYDQAREKFAHCLEKVSDDAFDEDWVFAPSYTHNDDDFTPVKSPQRTREKTRPIKNPPLLTEILQIIEGSNFNRQPRRVVNSKLFTAHDIAVTFNNIKAISQGKYYNLEPAANMDNAYYHESLHYLLSYGSHSAILDFFIKHEKYDECLLHVLDNKIDPEMFFNSVYLPCLKNGCIEKLHEALRSRDAGLLTWKNYLVFTCHCLETKKFFNTLYQLQIFAKDYVRASMSCIRFYVNGATNYTDLCSRSQYLHQAQKHLETELQAHNFGPKRKKSTGSQHSGQSSSLTLELELSDIDRHINTISRQMEIAKFLRNGEQEGRDARKFLNHLSNMENDSSKPTELPTLFGTQLQKTQLAVLAILCGRDVEEGFGIAFRIIQDYNLRSEKVYSLAGHILASEGKISSVEQLVKCCRSSGAPDTNALSDRVLAHCVKLVLNSSQMEPGCGPKDKVDSLIKLITDLELKISMCIESRQLKAAYLLAVRHSRAQDVRKIFKEADRLEQNAIKAICAKWLKQTQKS